LWSVGAVRIYVSEFDLQQPSVIGEVHVLDATKSTKHYSGSTGLKANMSGVLVTTDTIGGVGTELSTLIGYTEVSTARAITSDKGAVGSYYVKDVQAKRKQALNYSYPIYDVRLELLEA
jgi:hypothetical protein